MTDRAIPVANTLQDLRRRVGAWRAAGKTVALVPTMGALHEGHLELVRVGRQRCDVTVTSIFVNPTQFAPNEDFSRYPRTFEGDCAALTAAGGDLVWAPDAATMYPEGFATRIVPGGPAEGLESDFRPHFFAGVATVCTKLFLQVLPQAAIFGEKDYQQLAVVRRVARDLDLQLDIVGVPTVREPDGLALSSRNRYLGARERRIAPLIHQVIRDVARRIAAGMAPDTACAAGVDQLAAGGFGKVDYVAVRDAATLAPYDARSGRSGRVLAAAWLGSTRLIDNIAVGA